MKNKVKSLSFWLQLNGAIILILDTFASFFNINLYPDFVENLILSLCSLLIVLGIITKKNESDSVKLESQDLLEDLKNNFDDKNK